MSYILEALKKAQAERQLGEAPSIHAAQVVEAPTSRPAARGKPLLVVVAAGVLAAGVAAALVWRQQAPRQVAVVEAPGANAGATSAPPAVAPITSAPSAAAPVVNAPPAVAVPPVRVDAAPAPAVVHRPAPVPATVARSAATPSPEAAARASASVPASAAPAAPAPEEVVRTLAELPDSIRREVPKVSFGGYMYSPDPADRLVLVDKTLRHEGEEVAPGLRLEKLLPKSAVLNYKGYVFRVGL